MVEALCPICFEPFNKRGPRHKRCLDCTKIIDKQYARLRSKLKHSLTKADSASKEAESELKPKPKDT